MGTQKISLSSTYTLNSGFEIPVLGYGVYLTPPEQTCSVVQEAIKVGYRHVDSAIYYQNEAACCLALVKSGVPRENLFFTSKIPPNSMSYEGAKAEIKSSLEKAEGLGYIDLMLLHSPYGGREGRLGAWKALAEAVEAGDIQSIGVSNYGVHHLEELEKHISDMKAEFGKDKGGTLSVNQVEIHPWLPHRDIVEWCQKRGVIVQAWSPLSQGDRWSDPALKSISSRIGKTPAQVLLRWSLQKKLNPLPKSVTPSRIAENADVFDFELSNEDMAALETDEYDYHGWDPTTSDL